MLLDRLSGDDSGKKVWLQSAAACGGMPSNGKEEKIMGTGCNHHEMMVATEKRNPVNITFYLSKVISPMFLESSPHPKIPENKKNTYPSTSKRKATRNQSTGKLIPPNPLHRS